MGESVSTGTVTEESEQARERPLPSAQIVTGDCLESLRALPDNSVQTCITSPPYWGLRDYGHDGQIGLEATPDEYVASIVEVFREVRRVLADDGTLWLNLGDSYARQAGPEESKYATKHTLSVGQRAVYDNNGIPAKKNVPPAGLKPKDLIGIPWRVAFALQADGWYLRQDIIWHKPNPMPESVKDRCTKAHEYVFLMTKSERYYYDADSIKEKATKKPQRMQASKKRAEALSVGPMKRGDHMNPQFADPERLWAADGKRNKRSVWSITTKGYPGAHFAVMPEALVEPCIVAGSKPDDIVLDPFAGSGTVGVVALRHGRGFVGLELNEEYAALAEHRIADDAPLLNDVSRLTLNDFVGVWSHES